MAVATAKLVWWLCYGWDHRRIVDHLSPSMPILKILGDLNPSLHIPSCRTQRQFRL